MDKIFKDYKFHPSSLGLIMTESKIKGEEFGETCKGHMMECYIAQVYDRHKDVTNKYIEKGLLAEEDSITLYSRVKKTFFKKNEEVLTNDFFVGTPDLFTGEAIKSASEIIDIKTSWDIFTFFSTMKKAIEKKYVWQLQAYMDLTGAQQARLVYCLVDTPLKLVEDEKKKLQWTMGVIDPDVDEAYQAACVRIEKNTHFHDIPLEDRYIEFLVPRDQDAIDKAHKRVEQCREFLRQLYESQQ